MGHRRCCLARYGRTNRMQWFDVASELDDTLERGCAVVIRTARGEEMGEVLLVSDGNTPAFQETPASIFAPDDSRSRVIRCADDGDCERVKRSESLCGSRFDQCRHLLEDGRWPVEILDVEILLDGRTTVIDLVKSDDFDLTALRAQFRDWFDFDVILEPAAKENEAAIFIPADPSLLKAASSGGCGSGGCGSSGGGCGCRPSVASEIPNVQDSARPELVSA